MVETELRILVVDDNQGCRELFTLWLEPNHVVETAANGQEALAALDDGVDIVLLDRDMPGPSGTEVAHSIADGETDPFVVMVSSMEPDFDIVEFPIEGYLQKPIGEEKIRAVVEQYRAQQEYQVALDEFFRLTAKLATIEARKTTEELASSEDYARLKERVAGKRAEVDEALAMAQADWAVAFKSCIGGETAQVGNTNA